MAYLRQYWHCLSPLPAVKSPANNNSLNHFPLSCFSPRILGISLSGKNVYLTADLHKTNKII